MTLVFDEKDVKSFIVGLSLGKYKDNFSINKEITFKFKKTVDIKLSFDIREFEGDLEIDIGTASVAGLRLGIARKIAGEQFVKLMQEKVPKIKTWKNNRGNIQLSLPGVVFKQAFITTDNRVGVIVEL